MTVPCHKGLMTAIDLTGLLCKVYLSKENGLMNVRSRKNLLSSAHSENKCNVLGFPVSITVYDPIYISLYILYIHIYNTLTVFILCSSCEESMNLITPPIPNLLHVTFICLHITV